jgi:hypothetical protein
MPRIRSELLREIAEITGVLASLSEDFWAERIGLEAHLEELRRDIDSALEYAGARLDLTFRGEPVVGSVGIDAGFAAEMLDRISRAVAHQARAQGAKSVELHVTATPRGSFGFTLEGLGQQTLTGLEDPLSRAIEDIVRFGLAGANESDVDFESALEDGILAPLTLAAFRDFFIKVAERKATVAMQASQSRADFDFVAVSRVRDRVSHVVVTENVLWVSGVFAGVLGESRQFEHVADAKKEIIKGIIDPGVDLEHLASYFKKPCVAEILQLKTARAGRRIPMKHVLLGLHPPGTRSPRRKLRRLHRG